MPLLFHVTALWTPRACLSSAMRPRYHARLPWTFSFRMGEGTIFPSRKRNTWRVILRDRWCMCHARQVRCSFFPALSPTFMVPVKLRYRHCTLLAFLSLSLSLLGRSCAGCSARTTEREGKYTRKRATPTPLHNRLACTSSVILSFAPLVLESPLFFDRPPCAQQ